MKKEEIEEYVLNNYPIYSHLLSGIEEGLNTGLEWYLSTHPQLFKNRDFRPGTLGRFLSASMSVRFQMDQVVEFIKSQNWDKRFVEKYTMKIMKESGYLGHFKDIDQSIRFYLFHAFYHQLETTIRIIVEKLELEGKGKPITRVNKLVKCYPENFLQCIDAIRNTIHNNGYYKPIHKQPSEIYYENQRCKIHLQKDSRSSVSTEDTIALLIELIEHTECILKHETIESIPVTIDRN